MSKKKVKKPDNYVKTLEKTNKVYMKALNVILSALDNYDEVAENTKVERPEGATVIHIMTNDLRNRLATALKP